MDDLIELIVRGILALISGSAQKKKQQPPSLPNAQRGSSPRINPPRMQQPPRGPIQGNAVPEWNTSQNPRARQAVAQHAKEAAQHARVVAADQARHRAFHQSPLPWQPAGPGGPRRMARAPVPPIPMPAPMPSMSIRPAPAAVSAPAVATISAPAIRQLIRSRPTALRTIYVLSEVLGKPLAMRDSQ